VAVDRAWRRVRRHFSISAPRMAVRTHLPWPWRAAIAASLLALVGGMWWWGFDFGQIFGGFNRDSPTYTWTMFMYDQAFKLGLWRQGFAAAIGMIGAVAMMIVMVILLRLFRSKG